jgi:copper homeostasis protein
MEQMPTFRVEACVTSLSEALHAQSKGAHRLELCSRLDTEGMTPDLLLVKSILQSIHIPVRIMIRETETGFAASNDVLSKMKHSISQLKAFQPDGFVLGVVVHGKIDHDSMLELLHACDPYSITFHKAIDLTDDPESEIHWLNQFAQVDTVLTSGGAMTAEAGIDQILRLKKAFKGNIMAGGKITRKQLPGLHERLQLNWYHGRHICDSAFGSQT